MFLRHKKTANLIGIAVCTRDGDFLPERLFFAFITSFIFKKIKTNKGKLTFTLLFVLFWIVFLGVFKFNILPQIDSNKDNLATQKDSNLQIKEKLIGSWLDTSERKLHFTLFKDETAQSDNMETLLYKKWRLEGKTLILSYESIGNENIDKGSDKYQIILLIDEELVLKGGELKVRYIKKSVVHLNNDNF